MVLSYSSAEEEVLVKNNLLFISSIIDENNSILTNTSLNQVKRRRSKIIKDITAYFQHNQHSIAPRFIPKIYRILAGIVIPSFSSMDVIIEEALSLLTACSNHIELLRRIHRIEDYRTRLDHLYQGKKVDELCDFINEHKNYVFLYLNRETRENLLHYAINDDFVECTTLVCIHAKDCQATNHRNIYGDNCYHLAARQLKIKHLALLLKLNCMDTTVLNTSLQSPLQLLFISLRNIHFGTTINIASIEYDAEFIYDLVDRMTSRYINLCDFVAADKYGFDVFDYTISTRNVRFICLIMCRIEQLATHESVEFDWSKYLRHAILLDSPTITGVIAKQYLKSASSAALSCADFLCLAIIEDKGHALHALLNVSEFAQAVNLKSCNIDIINYNSTRVSNVSTKSQCKQEFVPLHHALLKFSHAQKVASSRHINSTELYHENILRTLLRYGADPYTSLTPNRIDNTFALAVDQGCVNSVRVLLLAAAAAAGKTNIEHIHCYPNGDKFYFNARKYHSNPLLSCIKPDESNPLRMTNECKMLDYLLLHTPFKALINLVSRSGKTPLILASMNKRNDLVQLLVHHGANYFVKIDSFSTINSRNNNDDAGKWILNEYRDIPTMTPPPSVARAESSLRTTIDALGQRKEIFYAVPSMCSKDSSVAAFLFLIYQIFKLFNPSLSKVKWIKSFLNYRGIIKILRESLDPPRAFSAEMTSKLYICILNALKVADNRYYVWIRGNVALPVLFVEWCKALNAVLDSQKLIDQSLLKEWVFTPHYTYPISYLLECVDCSHFHDYAMKQQEIVHHNHRIPILPTSKIDVRYNFWYDFVVEKKWILIRRYLDLIVTYDYHHLEELVTCAVTDRQDDIVKEIVERGGVIGRYMNHLIACIHTRNSHMFCFLLLCGFFDYTSKSFWIALRSALPVTVQGIIGGVGPLHTSVFQLQSSNDDTLRSVALDFAVIQSMIDCGLAYSSQTHADYTPTIRECLEYADTNRYLHNNEMDQLFQASPKDSFRESVLLPFLEYIITKSQSHLLLNNVVSIALRNYKQLDILHLAVKHNNIVAVKCVVAVTTVSTSAPTSRANMVLDKLRHAFYVHRNYCERINDAISMIDGHELFNDILQLVSLLIIHHSHLQSKSKEVVFIFSNLVSIINVDTAVANGMNSLFVDSNLLSVDHMVNIKTIPFQLIVNMLLYVNYYNVVYNKELMKGTNILVALIRASEKATVQEPYREIIQNLSRVAELIIRLLGQKELLEKYCYTLQSTGLYNNRVTTAAAAAPAHQLDHLDVVKYYVGKIYHLHADGNVDIVDKIISINLHNDALLEKFDALKGEFAENSSLLHKAFGYLEINPPISHIPDVLAPFVAMSFIDIVLLLENKVITTLITILISETSYQQIMNMNCGVRLHYACIVARMWELHISIVESSATSKVVVEYFNPEYQQAISLLLAEIKLQMTDSIRFSSDENKRYQRFYTAITALLAANAKCTKVDIAQSLDMRNIHVLFELMRSSISYVHTNQLLVRQHLLAKAASFGYRMNVQALVAAISNNKPDWVTDLALTAAITGYTSPPNIIAATSCCVGSWEVHATGSYESRKGLLEYICCIIKSNISDVSPFVIRTAPKALSPIEYAAIGGHWSLVKLLLSCINEVDALCDTVESLVLHSAILQRNQGMVTFVMSIPPPMLRNYLLSTRLFEVKVQHRVSNPDEKRKKPNWKQYLHPTSILDQSTIAFLDGILPHTPVSSISVSHSVVHDALTSGNVSILRNILINITDLRLNDNSIEFHDAKLVHYACYFDQHEVLSVLLSPPWSLESQVDELVELPFIKNGAQHFAQHKWTPIHVAACCGSTACLKVLLRCILSRYSTTPLVTQLLLRDSYKVAVYFKHQQCAIELFKGLQYLTVLQGTTKQASIFPVLHMNSSDHVADVAFYGMDCLLEYLLSYMCYECTPVQLSATEIRELFNHLIQTRNYTCALIVYRYIHALNTCVTSVLVTPPAINLNLFLRSEDEFYPLLRSILQCTPLSAPDLTLAPGFVSKNESESRMIKRQDNIDAMINKLRKALPSRPDNNLNKLKQSMQRSPQRGKNL